MLASADECRRFGASTVHVDARGAKRRILPDADAETNATQEKAHGPDEKVLRLVDMGFDAETATAALFKANGDEQAALEVLLGG